MSRQAVRFGSVGARSWGNRPVAIIGGGPSLRGFDFQRLRDRFTILAVNASMFDLPFADAGFSIDRRAARIWWRRINSEISFPFYLTIPDPFLVNFVGPPKSSTVFLRRVPGGVITSHPGNISSGGTSGFGALHFAYLKGARQIRLFGFDYRPAPTGEWHHNEQHYFPHLQRSSDWGQWAKNFDDAAPVLRAAGVEVVNASPRSAITAFPQVTIEEAIA